MFEDDKKEKGSLHEVCSKIQVDKREILICDKFCDSIVADINGISLYANVRNINFYISTVAQWLSDYQDGLYLGCYVNQIGDMVVALYHNQTIYLLGESYRTIMYAPKLMFHYVSPDHLHIDDVLMKHNSVGNGSIAMTALLCYSQSRHINKITGSLSSVDDDHKARRDNYYKKFGFNVDPRWIEKKL